ncbi:hypothetical protein AB6A40_004679 [Gnathostoma spinigerum]|uniref:Uncharacterized protein n=1 Tax=Gnathostoma spinigerum TaxID=75299 RepID=A0ABD6ENW5_9BILA
MEIDDGMARQIDAAEHGACRAADATAVGSRLSSSSLTVLAIILRHCQPSSSCATPTHGVPGNVKTTTPLNAETTLLNQLVVMPTQTEQSFDDDAPCPSSLLE